MGIRRAAQFAVPRDTLNVQFLHLKSSDPGAYDHQFVWHEQLEPKPAKSGIARASALLGQPANPAHQPVPILQFAFALVRLQLLGRRPFARSTEVITDD